jgi:hypothetical protein
MSTTTEQNKAVIWRFIDAWNSRQPDAYDDLIAPDVVRHCEAIPGVEARNLDQVKELLQQDTMVFPDSVPSGRKAQFDFRAVFRMNTVFVAVRFSAQPSNPATTAARAAWTTYEGTQQGPMGPFPPNDQAFGRRGESRRCDGNPQRPS